MDQGIPAPGLLGELRKFAELEARALLLRGLANADALSCPAELAHQAPCQRNI